MLSAAVVGVCSASEALAETTDDAPQQSAGHHRVDLSFSRIDTFEGDADILLAGYTLTLSRGFRVGLTLGYLSLEPDDAFLEEGAERASGWNDAQLVVQWDPGERITSHPWVPDQLGAYSIITAPTASSELTADLWEVEIGFGAPAFTATHFAFLPSAYIRTTFDEKQPETEDREVGFTPGLYWVVNENLWLGYAPTVAYNSTAEEWALDHSLTAGWLFRSGFGLGFSVERTDRIDLAARSDAYIGLLNFYFVFGEPNN